MPLLSDMNTFLSRTDIEEGDEILFVNAGEIKEVDFSRAKDGSNKKLVFQILVELPPYPYPILQNMSSFDNTLV